MTLKIFLLQVSFPKRLRLFLFRFIVELLFFSFRSCNQSIMDASSILANSIPSVSSVTLHKGEHPYYHMVSFVNVLLLFFSFIIVRTFHLLGDLNNHFLSKLGIQIVCTILTQYWQYSFTRLFYKT